jgi:hypothetical protein
MNTDTTTIDVYDVYGKKIIEGSIPVHPVNQALSRLKDYRDK